jgi:hypothetical protein
MGDESFFLLHPFHDLPILCHGMEDVVDVGIFKSREGDLDESCE